jgi:hypothetical protein
MPDRLADIGEGPPAALVASAGRREGRAARHCAFAAVMVVAGVLLASCSTGSDSSFSLFVEPGKYEYYSCEQIAGQIKGLAVRRKELKSLMERADQSVGGGAVGFVAYKVDYVSVGEELDLLQATAHKKNCEQDKAWRSSTAIQ